MLAERDLVDGLLLIASTRRAAYRAKPPRLFLALLRGRIETMFGFDRRAVAAMLPDTLAAKEQTVRDAYDLPPSHYVRKTRVADQIAACLLYHSEVGSELALRGLSVDALRGHCLGDLLLAYRVFGEPLDANVSVDDLRHLVAMYEAGGCFHWYVELYVAELSKMLAIEVAFRAAVGYSD